jgi:hypothetical protein
MKNSFITLGDLLPLGLCAAVVISSYSYLCMPDEKAERFRANVASLFKPDEPVRMASRRAPPKHTYLVKAGF